MREWHRRLWSKHLPGGSKVEWLVQPRGYLTCVAPRGPVRVSSDTIATTHSNYQRLGVTRLWTALDPDVRSRYERAFYTIGGFIIFPVHGESMNQLRGRLKIADRFDLTLECIRQHYLGEHGNPLASVLTVDADFFRLFGEGPTGFTGYVEFFHLQDFVSGDSIRWLDDFAGDAWAFEAPPLPQTASAYRRYLDNVVDLVAARNLRIRQWCETKASASSNMHAQGLDAV